MYRASRSSAARSAASTEVLACSEYPSTNAQRRRLDLEGGPALEIESTALRVRRWVFAARQYLGRCGRPRRTGAARAVHPATADLRGPPERARRWSGRVSVPTSRPDRPHVVGYRRPDVVSPARDVDPTLPITHHEVPRHSVLGTSLARSHRTAAARGSDHAYIDDGAANRRRSEEHTSELQS